jgi:hypothetical protein
VRWLLRRSLQRLQIAALGRRTQIQKLLVFIWLLDQAAAAEAQLLQQAPAVLVVVLVVVVEYINLYPLTQVYCLHLALLLLALLGLAVLLVLLGGLVVPLPLELFLLFMVVEVAALA